MENSMGGVEVGAEVDDGVEDAGLREFVSVMEFCKWGGVPLWFSI
jgi:hypothetical protein